MENYSAFPVIAPEHGPIMTGLSKREYFAALAMQGLSKNIIDVADRGWVVRQSVQLADELIKELARDGVV